MPLQIVHGDITTMRCDAIVNAANRSLLGGGGVDGAIHRAAGPGLDKACAALGGCETGQAKLTDGFHLPCRYIIHTVGPVWYGGTDNEEALLRSCYQTSLSLADASGCESVAFPLISAGAYGYPKAEALQIAVAEISAFLLMHDMLVYIVVYDKRDFQLDERRRRALAAYIEERYENVVPRARPMERPARSMAFDTRLEEAEFRFEEAPVAASIASSFADREEDRQSLRDLLHELDESFSQMLLRKIDEKGMTDTACYKKANIDRKLFSKIRSNVHYRPSKPTAVAFAVALELSLDETKELLGKAGFALSRSSKFDIIVEYYISNRNYNIFEINEALFAHDQSLLGA